MSRGEGPRPHVLSVAVHHHLEVVPPLPGCPSFPVREALVRWDVEGIGAQLRRGSRLASRVGCRSGLGRQGNELVCPGEVLELYLPPIRLPVVEPPDPHVNEVVQGTLS